jgi:hypothetical protein
MAAKDLDAAKRRRSTWKRAVLIYLLVIVVGYMLVPSIWGLTNGIILAMKLGPDPAFHKEIAAILSPAELKGWEDRSLKKLPQEKQIVIELIVEKYLQRTGWLPSHVLSNFATFAILGLVLGIIKVQRYWFIIPLCLLPATLRFVDDPFLVKNWVITLGVVLIVQVSSIYLFSTIGNWVRPQRKETVT